MIHVKNVFNATNVLRVKCVIKLVMQPHSHARSRKINLASYLCSPD